MPRRATIFCSSLKSEAGGGMNRANVSFSSRSSRW